MGRYSRLHRIQQMDPRQDYEEIFRWVTRYEFPWDYLQGVSIAFLRDFGVPRISRLLDRTQEFERAGQKRYDDTVLIAHEMVVDGMDSERARAAARHLNRIHGRYRIPDEDYLYVLATTVVGPKRWIDRYGWRPLCEEETESLALVGRRMGGMMGIGDLPADYAGFADLHDGYERKMFAYDPANRRVAAATLRVVTQWYPRLLRPLAARASLAVLDEPLLTALGLPAQPRPVRGATHRALRARAAVVRRLPPRPNWWPYRQQPRSYPFGWTLDDLGPHWAHTRPLKPLRDERPGAETAPAPRPPANQPPVAQRPVDQRPVAQPPVAQRPVAQPTAHRTPTDRQPTDERPVHRTPTDRQPTERRSASQRPTDQQPVPPQPTDQPSASRQPTDPPSASPQPTGSASPRPTDQPSASPRPADQQPTPHQPTPQQPTPHQPTPRQSPDEQSPDEPSAADEPSSGRPADRNTPQEQR